MDIFYNSNMYEFYPYFTNDGSVGLYSKQEDDIYHSTYGAITESWEKFIIPSGLETFLCKNNSVKILDICYGIGYNSKTAITFFLKNYYQKKTNIYTLFTSDIAQIHTDNILKKYNINYLSFLKKIKQIFFKNDEEIYTDNILTNTINYYEKNYNFNDVQTETLNDNESINETTSNEKFEFSIDAIDMDKTLIQLSPFIVNCKKKSFWNLMKQKDRLNQPGNEKLRQVKQIKKAKISPLKNEYKILDEVNYLLLESLLNNKKYNYNLLEDENIKFILSKGENSSFFDKNMMNLCKLNQKWSYNLSSKLNLLTFLHNIYYRYVSRSYKKAFKTLEDIKFDINIHNLDARTFIMGSDKTYNFIFLDAFTPAKCPALWTKEFFTQLYRLLDDNGVILTYSNSAAIRNAMLENNFYVGKVVGKNNKPTGTIASKNVNLIEHQLNEEEFGLTRTKAGISYKDEHLNLDNGTIIYNRNEEVKNSELISSSKFLKGLKRGKITK